MAVVALSGCPADSGISIAVDEKEARFVRSNVVKTLDLALEAAGGRKVKQRRRVTSSPRSELDPLGVDPGSRGFSATRLQAERHSDTDLNSSARDVDLNHGSYFRTAKDSEEQGGAGAAGESLSNIAGVGAGRLDLVDEAGGRDGGNLRWWMELLGEAAGETVIEAPLHGGIVPTVLAKVVGPD